jgi:hypothetical protein
VEHPEKLVLVVAGSQAHFLSNNLLFQNNLSAQEDSFHS